MSNEQNRSNNDNSIQLSQKNLVLMIVAAILVLCVCIAAVFTVIRTIRNDNPTDPGASTQPTTDPAVLAQLMKDTVAMTLGEHNINAVELNYFYIETVNQFTQEYYYYIYYYGLIDPNKPLDEQYYDKEKDITWSDYLLDITKETITSTYMLCDEATKEGFGLSESEKQQLSELKTTLGIYATKYKYDDVNSYLVDIFGAGSDLDSYMAYTERAMLADAYYAKYADSLTYTHEEMREFEGDKAHTYHSYTYATYYLDPAKFLTGGTEDENGKITYSDEQKAAALKAAEEAAKALEGNNCQDLEAFNQLILNMDINSNLTSVKVGETKDQLYSAIDPKFQSWVSSSDREVGDVACIPKTTKNADKEEVVEGFYIIWFGGINDNTFALKDVRHILVMFKTEDGKTANDNVTSFTDAQKAAAKAEAEKLLKQWQGGDATEDSFSMLAIKESEDPGSASVGGLYEYIYPGQMVEGFEKWCYDETRQHGDTGLVESVYGYHIMFFVGDSDMTYRDYMVSYSMRSRDLKQWHDALIASAELKEVCLDYCKLDMKLGQ